MTTFATMKARIEREMVRSDIDTEIAEAINSAISQYEVHSWWFNESITTTFSTVANQQAYSSSDSSDIPKFLGIDEVRLTRSSNSLLPLRRVTFPDLSQRTSSTTTTGVPTLWTWYAERIHLFPIPSGVWTIRVSGTKRGSDLSADGDTNGWMTHGEVLIRSAAKRMIAEHVVREPTVAAAMAQAEAQAFAALIAQNNYRQNDVMRIEPDGYYA